MNNGTTFTNLKKIEPVTLKSLEAIWEQAEIIPFIFKPTGEVVHTTPQIAQYINDYNNKKGGIDGTRNRKTQKK